RSGVSVRAVARSEADILRPWALRHGETERRAFRRFPTPEEVGRSSWFPMAGERAKRRPASPGCSQSRQRRMEPLWSPVVATGGNHRQIERTREPQKQAKSVATGCHRLPPNFHGKEGVDGSSPSEGFEKRPAKSHFALPKSTTAGT